MNEQEPSPESEGRKIEKRNIYFLKTHPQQELFFPDESATDIDKLAADILANELGEPIEILPNDTIISGHRRRSALITLVRQGHEEFNEVNVVVRYDLAAAGENAIKKRFLQANFNRRQLTPMEFARISRTMYELEHGETGDDVKRRELIAARFDMSAKTLERRWALLGLPLELQRLVGRGAQKMLPQGLAIDLVEYATEEELEAFRQLAINGGGVKKAVKQLVESRKVEKPPRLNPLRVLNSCIKVAQDLRYSHTDIGEIFAALTHDKKFRELRFGLRWMMTIVPRLLSTLEALPYAASVVEHRSIDFDEVRWEKRMKEAVERFEAELKRSDEDDDFDIPSSPARPRPPKPPTLVLKKDLPPIVLKKDLPPIVLKKTPPTLVLKKELPPLVLRKDPRPPVLKKDLPPLKLCKSPAA